MFAPRFTLPTRTPSKPAADKPTSSARSRTKPPAPTQPARQRRTARLAPEQRAARRVPSRFPPLPTLASVLSNRMARPLATTRRLLATSCAVSALVPPALRQMLREKIGKHLARHFEAPQWEYPIWLFAETEPLWGAQARRVFAGRGLRKMSLSDLHWLIVYEAERLARIVVERHPERTLAERVAALLGTLRRIGQVFRELRWRCGEQRALWHVNLALSAIHWW